MASRFFDRVANQSTVAGRTMQNKIEPDQVCDEHQSATKILDFENQPIADEARTLAGRIGGGVEYVRRAHQLICEYVSPVYTVDEWQPASVTFARGKGSCSQRYACLEAMARANGIPTRVRGLWISGQFWAPRFRLLKHFLPGRVLLAWPQFYLSQRWISVERIFHDPEHLAAQSPNGFTNDGESLFEAVRHTAVDFEGSTKSCANGNCDLSRFVLDDAGLYATRDQLFADHPLLQHSIRGRVFEWVFGGRKSV